MGNKQKKDEQPVEAGLSKDAVENGELKELLQRTQANFENYKKQVDARIKEIQQNAARNVLLEVLPVVDNFHLALHNKDKTQEFMEGVELIYSELLGVLEDNKVELIASLGKKFDPYFHEALMKVPDAAAEGIILEEFARGYLLHGHVLRPARVKVSAGMQSTPSGGSNDQTVHQPLDSQKQSSEGSIGSPHNQRDIDSQEEEK